MTKRHRRCQRILRPASFATRAASFRYGGRHHPGIPGGIIPLYPGGFVGIGTKVTIEDPAKKEKHIKSFSLRVDGHEVYAKVIADALELDLQRLVDGKLITRLSKHDTNPANNPQAPAHLRS